MPPGRSDVRSTTWIPERGRPKFAFIGGLEDATPASSSGSSMMAPDARGTGPSARTRGAPDPDLRDAGDRPMLTSGGPR